MSIIALFSNDAYLESLLNTHNFEQILSAMFASLKIYEIVINKQSFWKRKTLELNHKVKNTKNWFYEYQRQTNFKVFSKGANRNNHLKTNTDSTLTPFGGYDEKFINLYDNIVFSINLKTVGSIRKIIPGFHSTLIITNDDKYYGLGFNNFLNYLSLEKLDTVTRVEFPFVIKSCKYLINSEPSIVYHADRNVITYLYLDDKNQLYIEDMPILTNYKVYKVKVMNGNMLLQIQNNKFLFVNYSLRYQGNLNFQVTNLHEFTFPTDMLLKGISLKKFSILVDPIWIAGVGDDYFFSLANNGQIYCYSLLYKKWLHLQFPYPVKNIFAYRDLILTTENNEIYIYSGNQYPSIPRKRGTINRDFPFDNEENKMLNLSSNTINEVIPYPVNKMSDDSHQISWIKSTFFNLVYIRNDRSFMDGFGIYYENAEYDERQGDITRRWKMDYVFSLDVDKIYLTYHLGCGIFGIAYGEVEVNYLTYLETLLKGFVITDQLRKRVIYDNNGNKYHKDYEFENITDFANTELEFMVLTYSSSIFPEYRFVVKVVYSNSQIFAIE